MKKLIFILCLLYSLNLSSQEYFILTESGLVSKSNNNEKYIVVEVEGSENDLYNSIKGFVTNYFVSPKDVLSESDNMISINGVSTRDIKAKKGFANLSVKMNYTIVFHFKENKIRIDIPKINNMTSESTTLGGDLSGQYIIVLNKNMPANGREKVVIFDKGNIKNKVAKETIEEFFNKFISSAINYKLEEW